MSRACANSICPDRIMQPHPTSDVYLDPGIIVKPYKLKKKDRGSEGRSTEPKEGIGGRGGGEGSARERERWREGERETKESRDEGEIEKKYKERRRTAEAPSCVSDP